MSDDRVAIGQIIKPFGVKGDVHVRSLSDVPGRFESLRDATLETSSGRVVKTSVQHVRPHGNAYVVRFGAFSSPEEAGLYRGALITIPRDGTVHRTANQYLHCDLIGLSVWTEDGRDLGGLEEIYETAANAVFAVRKDGREILVPATREVVMAVDLDQGKMIIRPLPGLIDEADDAL